MLLLFMTGLKGGDAFSNSIKGVEPEAQGGELGARGCTARGVQNIPSGLSLNGQQVEMLTGASRLRPGD